MNLEDLTRRFRVMADDTNANPPLFKNESIADWLTDAEAQAAIRGRLLLEDANAAVCELAVSAGVHTYALHPKLYELVQLRFKATGMPRSTPVRIVTREWLDSNIADWRDTDDWHERSDHYAIQGETSLRLVPTPTEAGTVFIEGYRLPLKALASDTDKPEIHEASHEKLIYWALHRAFSVPDSETVDPQRSANAEAEFTRYFGPLPDADLRRSTRHDSQQTVKVFWP